MVRLVLVVVTLSATLTSAGCSDGCCTCLKGAGGAGCASQCGGCSSACQACVKGGGGSGCIDDGRCTCGGSGGSTFTVSLAGTQKCLDLTGGDASDGTLLEIWDCNGLANQNWVFAPGSWRIAYAGDTSKCIDALGGNPGPAGTKLGIWSCNGRSTQKWGYDADEKTIYLADSVTDASLCMDLAGGDQTNGTPIQVWDCYGGSSQQWILGAPPAPPPPGPGPGPGPSPGGGCYDKNGISGDQLNCVFTQLDSSSAARFAGELNNWMGDSLTNACKWAAFLGNVGTESNGLTEWTEQPCSQTYCGRGPLQITGQSNYAFCAKQGTCKCSGIESNPGSAASDENTGMGTASCVWKSLSGHDLSNDVDGTVDPGLLKTACLINAGHYPCGTPNGWQSRQDYWHAANKCLGISTIASPTGASDAIASAA